ncbi:hypothetical protein FHS91_003924 [Sphingobium xanthum]|uniref:hypothetical protein n=1 Tax=Sphingobium xanthum TaxID=1387165 RepID=UPI001C8CD175|nr:hypothetical protein [Sphingobium xanthum]
MPRRIVIEREAPFLRRFVVRFEPALIGDKPQAFCKRADAFAHGLELQKRLALPLTDLTS